MLGFFVQKGEIFTSPNETNDRPEGQSWCKYTQLCGFCKMQPHNLIHNVGWGLIIQDVEVVVHSANVLG